MDSISLKDIIPFLIPLVILQIVMMIFALIDLSKRQKTRGPKWMWGLIIILGELLGPVVYFLFGRGDE